MIDLSISMQFLIKDFAKVDFWIDLGVSLLIIGMLLFYVLRHLKRKAVYIFYAVSLPLYISAYILEYELVRTFLMMTIIISSTLFLFINIGEIRALLANPLKTRLFTSRKDVGKVYDREALFQKVNEAIIYLSKTKTGALLTFEKKVRLDDMISSGTTLNAPVTSELLITIFYPGTRLHDGAVVIRDDIIKAASVYYTPTTKALTGKYGARHRAAIGISEICDAVTVIVSEETGRISIACNGELEQVTMDNFLRVFVDYMIDDNE